MCCHNQPICLGLLYLTPASVVTSAVSSPKVSSEIPSPLLIRAFICSGTGSVAHFFNQSLPSI